MIAFVCLLGCLGLHAQPTFTNATVHDPSIVRAGATFYVFGSHLASASTTDLMNWTQISTSPAAGNALVPNAATEFQEVLTWAQTNTFWAPDVIQLQDGRYYMYYCACRGDSPRSALGLAVSDSIGGPYQHVAVLLKSGMNGVSEDGTPYDATKHPNVVDPSVFFDQTGNLWMVYGSYSGGIFILEMDPATGRQKPGQGYGKKLMGGNHARIEGAYILYAPESEYYYLFVSFGGLNAADGYNIRVGRSRNPDGPFVDAAGTDLVTVAGAPGTVFDDASIAPHGVKLMGGYQFLHVAGEPQATSRGYLSPGHNSAYRDPVSGKYFNVFHTRFVGRGEQHEVRVHQMFINADGWPVVAPHRYAQEAIVTTNASAVAGEFKLINHGKAISGAAVQSVPIALQANGTVSGSATGTWTLAGGRNATFVLGGETYRGVFVRQWDDDNGVWVWAFTALSDDGVAIWGSKVASAAGDPPPSAPGAVVRVGAYASGPDEVTVTWQQPASDDATGYKIERATNSVFTEGLQSFALTTATTSWIDTSVAAGANYFYRVYATNESGESAASETLQVQTPAAGGVGKSKFAGIATRARCGTGNAVTIGGFVINGSAPKRVLIRAVGPTLTTQGIGAADVLADPVVVVHDANNGNVVIAENDDWGTNANASEITAVSSQLGLGALDAGDAKSSALLRVMPPGVYTFVVSGKNAAAGVVLLEVYDADFSAEGSTFAGIATRAFSMPGNDVAIGGFVIGGAASKRVLVRAVGATLVTQGLSASEVLADPVVTLHRGSPVIATNDQWADNANAAEIRTTSARLGASALADADAKSSVLLLTLPPGAYSFIAAGKSDTSGVVLVEVYDAD